MIKEIIRFLSKKSVEPDEINEFLEKAGTAIIKQKVKAITLATRPQIELKELLENIEGGKRLKVVKSRTDLMKLQNQQKLK